MLFTVTSLDVVKNALVVIIDVDSSISPFIPFFSILSDVFFLFVISFKMVIEYLIVSVAVVIMAKTSVVFLFDISSSSIMSFEKNLDVMGSLIRVTTAAFIAVMDVFDSLPLIIFFFCDPSFFIIILPTVINNSALNRACVLV